MRSIVKYLNLILGILLASVSFNLFIIPLNLVVGGTNGLAVLVNKIFGMDANLFIQLFYLFVLVLSIVFLGLKDTKNAIIGTILYPIFIEFTSNLTSIIQLDYSNKLLMCFVASVLMGVGNGLIYKEGLICGGTDVIKKILNVKKKFPMSKSAFIIDTLIVALGGFIFGLKSVLYAIIVIYISSKITDVVMLGISSKKLFYIMTKEPDKVRNYIKNNLKCGITEIDGVGGFTNNKYHVLMCAISTREYIKLEREINEIDESAFFIITDIYHMHYVSRKVKYGINKNNKLGKEI